MRGATGFFKSMRNAFTRHPFITGVGLAGFKSAACDAGVQKLVEKREQLDLRRVTVFGSFGLIFAGAWQYLLFVKIMPRIVPGATAFIEKPLRAKLQDWPGMRGVLIQNFIENGINNPILFFPIFYSLKEFIEGGNVKEGLAKYKLHYKEDVIAIWKLWIPAQLFNFAFSPMWLRVPFVAFVSAFWTSYISITRGAPESVSREEDELHTAASANASVLKFNSSDEGSGERLVGGIEDILGSAQTTGSALVL